MDVVEMFLCAMVLVLMDEPEPAPEPCLMEISLERMYFTGGNLAAMEVTMGIIEYLD